ELNNLNSNKENIIYKFHNNKIMLVEDIDTNLMLMIEFLKKYDMEVVTALNGIEALEKLKTFSPDLIFMDIQMPKMDGYSTTKIIREKEQFKNIPIIAFT